MTRTHIIPLAFALILVATPFSWGDTTIWDGPPLSFEKVPFGDPLLPETQDRITDSVWITRGNSMGLFNAARETFANAGSPSGTAWAVGTTDDVDSLTFGTWLSIFGNSGPLGGPPNTVGHDFVVHLLDDDVYLDLRVTGWGMGGTGGGSFSYVRSTRPVPEPSAVMILSGCLWPLVAKPRRRHRARRPAAGHTRRHN